MGLCFPLVSISIKCDLFDKIEAIVILLIYFTEKLLAGIFRNVINLQKVNIPVRQFYLDIC